MNTAFTLATIFILFSIPSFSADSFLSQFQDKQDGAIDLSEWLQTASGFVPIMVPITEPALGFGVGGGLVFFHRDADNPRTVMRRGQEDIIPPSLSASFGLATTNGSYGYGGGHSGVWRNDRLRYVGVLAKLGLNLDFYGVGDYSQDKPYSFHIQTVPFLQEMSARIGETDLFLGARYVFLDSKIRFKSLGVIPGIDEHEFNSRTSGIGPLITWDSRDNTFTPNAGTRAQIYWGVYDGALGGQHNYQRIDTYAMRFWQLHQKLVVGGLVNGHFTTGDVPFYHAPFIFMRGIPAMRYQGKHVLNIETEGRWNVTRRWAFVGFVGAGATASESTNFSFSDAKIAGGAGFRYLLAQTFNLYMGADIARGPEEWAFYISFGQAWTR